jgi:ferredoxin/flavodoxin---NADP+ reductase
MSEESAGETARGESASGGSVSVDVVSPTIAIVGSGPSGCYLAQFLRKRFAASEIVIFDRLAEPYGLVRYGVAPDHLGTKAVTRQFDRLFERDGVRFVGNTEIGTDVTLDSLRASFDIVVLATGLWADRSLELPGVASGRVYGAGAVTRLINGHPGEVAADLSLGSRVTIVGNGNVAIDLVRLILTPAEELRALGVADDVIAAINAGPVTHIDVVGRSAVDAAKFDTALVKELAKLPDVSFHSDDLSHAAEPTGDSGDSTKRDAVASIIDGSPAGASRQVHFHFGWTPNADSTHEAFVLDRGFDQSRALDSHAIVTAIGFGEHDDAAIIRADHESDDADIERGILGPGLYCVGWLRRGPVGTIPANRTDSKMVADVIATAIDAGEVSLGKPGLSSLTRIA